MSSAAEGAAPEKPLAIVIGHADFTAGMRSAVHKITGRGAALMAMSGQQLSLPQIEDVLRRGLDESGVRVIFTDLQAGSSTMAARKVMRDRPTVILVVGTNLPILLDFVLSTNPNPLEAARHAVERGCTSIAVHGGGA